MILGGTPLGGERWVEKKGGTAVVPKRRRDLEGPFGQRVSERWYSAPGPEAKMNGKLKPDGQTSDNTAGAITFLEI
jgi:hypothetical protein